MPAAMEEWRSTSAGSKEEESAGGDAGSVGGAEVAGGNAKPAEVPTTFGKRQRRPSVRLGEIGDQKRDSKLDIFSIGRWSSPVARKNSNVANGGGKAPRTRPVANVTPKAGKDAADVGTGAGNRISPGVEVSAADGDAEAAEEPPSAAGRGNLAGDMAVYGPRRGKQGKRKRASSIRSSTIAKTLGVVSSNRKAKELNQVLATVDAQRPNGGQKPVDSTAADMEEESGAARGAEEDEGGDHADTEVLEDDGNGEDSSGRQEGDEPESPGVRDNHMNGRAEPARDFLPLKDDREQCTSRLTDGDKERKHMFREASMIGRRGGVRGWLGSLSLEKYADLFEENEVDNHVLPLLTFEDLKEMGIVAVGARRKMYAGIQELNRHA